jgi:hypothetical protein
MAAGPVTLTEARRRVAAIAERAGLVTARERAQLELAEFLLERVYVLARRRSRAGS